MSRLDRIFIWIVLAPVLPLVFLLAGWWGSLPLADGESIWIFALGGLVLGIVLDAILLGKATERGYQLPWYLLVLIYSFYMVGLFGFMMGVPVLNVIPGLVAGFYVSRRVAVVGYDPAAARRWRTRTAWFVLSSAFCACIASAVIALLDPSTPANLGGMFGLGKPVTKAFVWTLILGGGSLLLISQVTLIYLGGWFARRLKA